METSDISLFQDTKKEQSQIPHNFRFSDFVLFHIFTNFTSAQTQIKNALPCSYDSSISAVL